MKKANMLDENKESKHDLEKARIISQNGEVCSIYQVKTFGFKLPKLTQSIINKCYLQRGEKTIPEPKY